MTFSTWSYTSALTVWPVTNDAYGQPTFGPPQRFKGTFGQTSESKIDEQGVEFVPASVYWTRYAVQKGWYIARGTHIGNPPPDAEIIRKIVQHDSSMHGDTGIDVEIYT